MAVCEALKPLLKPPARIVNVSSRAGLPSIIRDAGRRNAVIGALSKDALSSQAGEFVSAIRTGCHQQQGWPSSMYGGWVRAPRPACGPHWWHRPHQLLRANTLHACPCFWRGS